MVRRAASAHLATLAAAMHDAGEHAALTGELLPLFSQLSTDEQDSVRPMGCYILLTPPLHPLTSHSAPPQVRLMGVGNCAAMGKL